MAAESSTRMKDRRNDEFTRNNDVTVSENNLIPQNQADLVCLILKISINDCDWERWGVDLFFIIYCIIIYIMVGTIFIESQTSDIFGCVVDSIL